LAPVTDSGIMMSALKAAMIKCGQSCPPEAHRKGHQGSNRRENLCELRSTIPVLPCRVVLQKIRVFPIKHLFPMAAWF
jgi:hypothetical protein